MNDQGGVLVRERLDNGLTVLMRPSRGAPVVSFWVWYRVGSRNEGPGMTGASHWVEHMLFRGTPQFPGGLVHRLIAREGGIRNGMTSYDFTCYFETLPADRVDLALRIEADRMINAQFAPEDVEAERTIILAERAGRENQPTSRLHEAIEQAAFQVHSYGHPVIGWREDLERMTRDMLYAHYRTCYAPDNAVISIAGDFQPDEMKTRVAELFGAIPPAGVRPVEPLPEPPRRTMQRVRVTGQERTSYVEMAFPAPPAVHPDYFPMVALQAILGGAAPMTLFGGGGAALFRSARLYRALVERELAARTGCSVRPSIDPHLFLFFAAVRQGITPQTVEDALWAEIERVCQEPVAEAELAKALRQARAQFVYSSESVTNQAFWLGYSEVIASAEWFFGFTDALARVTAADVQRVAQAYLQRDQAVVGWYVPNGP
ncbi:MAG: pitrilysin family protein [Anaerolineae bacterium]|nr:insulinase family protein [Anaerolineae bacterium]MDW8098844.1 pitrilysin family protein [Anaerolineae bacterium]